MTSLGAILELLFVLLVIAEFCRIEVSMYVYLFSLFYSILSYKAAFFLSMDESESSRGNPIVAFSSGGEDIKFCKREFT